MFSKSIAALFLTTGSYTYSAPTDWEGVFSEEMYGGEMHVCVSELESGVYYGQAAFSTLGYMRGVIDPITDQWNGDYYLMGEASVIGTFQLELTQGAPNTYTATWNQKPGYEIQTTGVQSSTVTPSDVECFRTDNMYLGNSPAYFSYTGSWEVPGGTVTQNVGTGSDFYGSYVYEWTHGFLADGYMQGPLLANGQISTHNWYEHEDIKGLELTVAKNETAFYLMWWFADSLSEIDISQIDEPDHHAAEIYYRTGNAYDTAEDNYCLVLNSETKENACQEAATTCSSSDDDDDESMAVSAATLAFGVINFIAITVFGVLMVVRTGAGAAGGAKATEMKGASPMH